jgi:hypothetical protein
MRRIDELHLELPFYGSRRMIFELNKEHYRRGGLELDVVRDMYLPSATKGVFGMPALNFAMSLPHGSDCQDRVCLGRMPCKTAQLSLNKLAIKSVLLHQVIRRTVLNDAPRPQDDNSGEISHRRQSMRDRNYGSSAHEAGQRRLDHILGFAIERRRRFVQQ